MGRSTHGIGPRAPPFRWLLADPRTEGVPLVLETRQADPDIPPDDPSPDPNDVAIAEPLRKLSER